MKDLKKTHRGRFKKEVIHRFAAGLLVATFSTFAVGGQAANNVSVDGTMPNPDNLAKIVFPANGSNLISTKPVITLGIARDADPRSLVVKLNGKDITALFHPTGDCRQEMCTSVASPTLAAGLQTGANEIRLRVQARGQRGDRSGSDVSQFNWQPSNQSVGLTDSQIQLTPAVGFTTTSPGGQQGSTPWVQVYSNALHGGTLTYPKESPCAGTYQILTLNRQTLVEDSYTCYGDDTSFKNALGALTPSDPSQPVDLVIAGTTYNHVAGSQLNTTSIGGTDYSKYAAADQPTGYMIAGVPGAAAGSASEHYQANGEGTFFSPRLNGLLTLDSNNNYNFADAGGVVYSVDATKSVITVGTQTFTPPNTVQNGFWLLTIHRWSLGQDMGCQSNDGWKTYPNCGSMFDTGNSDATVASAALASLNNALKTASKRDLVFLVTVGSNPFGAPMPGYMNGTLEGMLGFPVNTFKAFADANITGAKITLISCTDPNFSKAMIDGHAVVASSSYFQQGENGSVFGVLTRDGHSLYQPSASIQGTPAGGDPNKFFSFYQVPYTQPVAWDSLATPALQAAYRYLSYQLVAAGTNNNTNSDDIHAIYYSTTMPNVIGKDPTTIPMPTSVPWTDPIDNQQYTFEPADLNAEATLLKNELGNLKQVNTFVTQITPYLFDGNTTMLGSIIQAAADTGSEVTNAPSNASLSLNLGNIANLLGASLSIANGLLNDNELGPVFTVFGGILNAVGSYDVYNPPPNAIPNPWNNITTTVSEVSSQATTMTASADKSWGLIQDNVESDQARLNAFAYNADNAWAGSNHMSWPDLTDSFGRAAKLSFYTQIFGSVNQVDYYPAYPYPDKNNASQINKWHASSCAPWGSCSYTCVAIYPKTIPANGWNVYSSLTQGYSDFYVINGPIKDNKDSDVSFQMPTQTQLDTLFGTADGQFNLAPDMFYSTNGPLARRTGGDTPNYGFGLCDNVGDSTMTPGGPD